MKTYVNIMASALILVGGLLTATRTLGQDSPADDAMKLATRLTDEGAATFSKADAKAMAAYYAEDAIVFMQTRNDDGRSVKEYDGPAEIERLYADLFKREQGSIRAKNHVEYARLLTPDLLVIAGTFEPNLLAVQPRKVPFYQVRVKQGDNWLIHSIRIFILSEKR